MAIRYVHRQIVGDILIAGEIGVNLSIPMVYVSDGTTNFPLAPFINATPATSGATGVAGEIRWDSSYIYVCTATNTWKRAAIATW